MAEQSRSWGGRLEVQLAAGLQTLVGAHLDADVVFVSTDAAGTPGELNERIFRKMGLPLKMPSANDLRDGYALQQVGHRKICFVVTVEARPTAVALEANLTAALSLPIFNKFKQLWIPLMGTGAGGLSLVESFEITAGILLRDPRIISGNFQAVVSLPEEISPEQSALLEVEIVRLRLASKNWRPSEYHREEGHDLEQWGDLPLSLPVLDALRHASVLLDEHPAAGDRISASTLLLALVEGQDARSPASLRDDPAADYFAAAVRHLAGERYHAARSAHFGNLSPEVSLATGRPEGRRMSRSLQSRIKDALELYGAAQPLQLDHLIQALIGRAPSDVAKLLEDMGLAPDRLLAEYRDARLGQVAKKFNNDLATSEDRLGYASYATAIHEFLTHADTVAPLSISIQAPWGAGKSSLMNLVREKLDPREVRDTHKNSKIDAVPSLLLGEVLKFLDQEKSFKVAAKAETGHTEGGDRRWTIWFNAWQYETSEQIWAGLVDAVIDQVSQRLPSIEREKFLLRLQLARIDDTIVRRRIYERIVSIFWDKVRPALLTAIAAGVAFVGARLMDMTLPALLTLGLQGLSLFFLGGALFRAFRAYRESNEKVRAEPAKFVLADYLRVPDYSKALGEIHHINDDLKRVLAVLPRQPGKCEHSPLVIFIDDLDRCSPGKVASVVEGVSMLLASENYRCMFVIGMDPQMVAAALEAAHDSVRKQLPRYERATPLGWRFMDKFVQLPFTIPPTTAGELSGYVNWLLGVETAPQARDEMSVEGVTSEPAFNGTLALGGAANMEALSEDRAREARNEDGLSASSGEPLRSDPELGIEEAAFVESRDVGEIIRKVSSYSVGNPREMKRMVNMARFYLALRSARRARDPGWRAPSLDQYARWIAVTLRWPDMMRWLQWGADEASWPSEQQATNLVVRRLRALERDACDMNATEWRTAIEAGLGVHAEIGCDWAKDPKLHEFFKMEAQLSLELRLSAGAERGFW